MAATAHYLNSNIINLLLFSNGNHIGSATGFILKYKNDWFLVTNWHVLSGRDPTDGQSRNQNSAIPDTVKFNVLHFESNVFFPKMHEVKLLDWSGDSLWFHHPIHGQNVDIACLLISESQKGTAKDLLEPGGNDPEMFIDMGHDLFLPGFPLGFSANGLPIWKRASLASSLEFDHGMKYFFYVDTATREGMSGSPCLAISNWKHYSLDRATGKVKVVEQPMSWRLFGIYSGRRNPSDGFEAQIGIVWRETLMLEILAARKRATYILREKEVNDVSEYHSYSHVVFKNQHQIS